MESLEINKSKKFSEFFDEVDFVRKIDFLVLHHVEANSAQHAIDQFLECKVSSHFLIDESGEIFQLVDENNIAYHAGVSFWRGVDGLNKTSIGIEFINSAPFDKKFELVQMQAGVKLCKYLIKKYNIEAQNIVGHSDIAYDKETGFLDRKQDPSHLFDWKFLAQNGVSISANNFYLENDNAILKYGDTDSRIGEVKKSLMKFGYKVFNLDNNFDSDMMCLAVVFNRRFSQRIFQDSQNAWHESSQLALDKLLDKLNSQ